MLGGGKANPPVMVGGRRRTPYVGYVRTLRDRRERSRGDLVPGHASNGKGSSHPDRGRPVRRGVYSPARLRHAAPRPSHNGRGVLRPPGRDAGNLRGPNVARDGRIVRLAAAWHPPQLRRRRRRDASVLGDHPARWLRALRRGGGRAGAGADLAPAWGAGHREAECCGRQGWYRTPGPTGAVAGGGRSRPKRDEVIDTVEWRGS